MEGLRMSDLNPRKLHTKFKSTITTTKPLHPRYYTLTHSDRTGDLFLTISDKYERKQIAGWYTRLMRDEVLAEWRQESGETSLHVHCHVSGGLVLGGARWRAGIFRHHMRQVLEAFRYGDQALVNQFPLLDQAPIWVHFHARQKHLDQVEHWGVFGDYTLPATPRR
jgi:hypothetical protein